MPRYDSPEDVKRKCAERKAKRDLKGRHNPVGRPKGGNLLQKMINESRPKDVEQVFSALMEAATDSEHKNFAYANKAITDRMAHISNYEKTSTVVAPTVNINIGSLAKTDKPVVIDGEVVEEP